MDFQSLGWSEFWMGLAGVVAVAISTGVYYGLRQGDAGRKTTGLDVAMGVAKIIFAVAIIGILALVLLGGLGVQQMVVVAGAMAYGAAGLCVFVACPVALISFAVMRAWNQSSDNVQREKNHAPKQERRMSRAAASQH